ncbi:MAG: HAD family hydrolase [Planctomycetota bacterium]
MNRITSLVFDLDQTLFDRRRAFDDWLADLSLSRRDSSRLRFIDQNGYGNRDLLFKSVETLTGEPLNQHRFVNTLMRFVEPNATLRTMLTRLRSDFRLAVLTNGGVATQIAKLKALALDSVFAPNRIFISAEIGFEKPDVAAFEHVASALKAPAGRCMYFGDRSNIDVSAALAAGWKACLVDGPTELQRKLRSRFGVVA